jgi:hypothetical protein
VDGVFPQCGGAAAGPVPAQAPALSSTMSPLLIGPVLRIFLDAVEERLKASSPGAPAEARFGAVPSSTASAATDARLWFLACTALASFH